MLYGKMVRLGAIEREHLPNFVRWFNDPDVRGFLAWDRPMSSVQEDAWFENASSSTAGIRYVIEAPVGKDAGWIHIGSVGLETIAWQERCASMGIMIGEKEYWDRGYGTDGARTMLGFAFGTLNLHRVQLDVYDFNLRAIRCYEKLGFRREGTKRQALFRDGRYHDVHIMSILVGEFLEERTSRATG